MLNSLLSAYTCSEIAIQREAISLSSIFRRMPAPDFIRGVKRLAVVQVGGVPEVADALGIGEATVKTHLHRLFGKTDIKRQSDLVKLVAGFSSPFVH